MGRKRHHIAMTATALAVAVVVSACKGRLHEAERLNLDETPIQTVRDMFFVQTENGQVKMRAEADRMERYDTDSATVELFPDGVRVFAYSEEGLLETTVVSDRARHFSRKKGDEEYWVATGHVVVRNVMKQETMQTDTLYWDRTAQEIHTDSYVELYSPSGYMQGYGMRSDEMARHSVIHRPFDSYGVVVQDSTEVVLDTANFIGPLPERPLIDEK